MFQTAAGILAARAYRVADAVAPRAHRQAVLALDDRGAIGFTGVLSTQDGLSISGGGHFNVSNLSADFCAQDGVSLGNGAVVNVFHGIASIGNGRWGWFESWTADFNIKVGANIIANNTLGSGGSITQVGAHSAFCDYMPNSGTFAASTVGAASVA